MEIHGLGRGFAGRVKVLSPHLKISNQTDPLKLYFQEISRVPLLSIKQENALSRIISKNETTLFRQLKRKGLKEEEDIAKIIQTKDVFSARQMLIKANQRLVVSFAIKYQWYGRPLLDLIQEGSIGLIKVIQKYDYARGYRFSTYVGSRINQSILIALARYSRTIRLPANVISLIKKTKKVEGQLTGQLGRKPTMEEVAIQVFKLDPNDREEISEKVEFIKKMSQWAERTVSLNRTIDEDEKTESISLLVDKTPGPEELSLASARKEEIRKVINKLPENQKKVICLRYGLDIDDVIPETLKKKVAKIGIDNRIPRTFEKVGKIMSCTREYARQLEAKALGRISPILRLRKDLL